MADGKYKAPGRNWDYTPGSAKTADEIVAIGDVIGVVINDIAANAQGAVAVEGVFALPCDTVGFAQGVKVYWDSTASQATETPSNNRYIGTVAKAATTANSTVDVYLKPDGRVEAEAIGGATITVGDETTDVINVAVQLTDENDADLAVAANLPIYLASDTAGLNYHATGVDSWAIGTDGSLLADGGDSVVAGRVTSEADGDFDLDLTHSGAETVYLVVVLPNGKLAVSGAITFDGS